MTATTISTTHASITLTAGNYASYQTISITSAGSVTAATGSSIYSNVADAWTIINDGLIQSTATAAGVGGVVLKKGGTVTNDVGGIIAGGSLGAYIAGTAGGLISNSGTIKATATNGIGVKIAANNATLINAGTIAATTTAKTAISLSGSADVLVLDPGFVITGKVIAAASDIMELASGAAIGTVSGIGAGISGFGTATIDAGATWLVKGTFYGALNNAGTLVTTKALFFGGSASNSGVLQAPFYLLTAGTLTNQTGGTVTGNTSFGAVVNNSGTVVNAGLVTNSNTAKVLSAAIYVQGYGVITNAASGLLKGSTGINEISSGQATIVNSGTIIGAKYAGAALQNGGTITNYGTISGVSSGGKGAIFKANGVISNASGGTIVGAAQGIYFPFGEGSIQNAGVIKATAAAGVGIELAQLTNSVGNTGTISGAAYGVRINSGSTISNSTSGASVGYISGGRSGIDAYGGGTLVLTNAGTIKGTGTASAGVYMSSAIGVITNGASGNTAALIQGVTVGIVSQYLSTTLTNFGTVAGSIAFNVTDGVISAGNNTITNAGTIKSTTGSAGTAIQFGRGNDLVIIDPGAVFVGKVDGAAGTNTVELAGTSAATLSGIGTQFTNFTRIVIDAGSNWSLTDTLTADMTLMNAGTIGSLHLGSARFIQQGSAVLDGPTLSGGAGSVFEVASNQTIQNLGSNFSNLGSIAIDSGVIWTMTGTNSIAAGTTLNNTGTVVLSNATLTNAGGLVNNGAIVIDPSSMTVGDLSGTGSVIIGSDSTLIVQGTISSGQTIVFADQTGILELDDAVAAAGTIDGFVTGNTITLGGVTDATAANIVNANTLEVTRSGHSPIDLTFDPSQHFTGATFNVPTSGGNTVLTANDLACFAAGTRMATPDGPVPVEALREGDQVCTASGARRAVRWIGFRHVDLSSDPAPERARPIRIRANAVAFGRPNRDLRLSPDHAVLLESALIPVKLLRNDVTIERDNECRSVTYYHVELDKHDILLAEDLPVESYLDTGNRGVFENALRPDLHPDFSNNQHRREAESCAPFVDDPIAVQMAWRGIAQRAVDIGYERPVLMPTTNDPLLHVTVAGRRYKPVCLKASRYVFMLPTTAGGVSIVSRHAIPSLTQPWVSDDRRLGVRVRQIALRRDSEELAISMDHPMLSGGWWAVECEGGRLMRWTDGSAVLDVPSGGPAVLEIDLDATLPYPLTCTQDCHAAF